MAAEQPTGPPPPNDEQTPQESGGTQPRYRRIVIPRWLRLFVVGEVVVLVIASALLVWMLIQKDNPESTESVGQPVPTATMPPNAKPSPTVRPTAEPTVTPTVLPSLTLTLHTTAPQGKIAADGRSTAAVTVIVDNPQQLDLTQQELFLQAQGGGSINPTRVTLNQLPVHAEYTAGESANVSDVTITAIVDLPGRGRISESTTITLVREKIAPTLPCGYVLSANQIDAPLSFRVSTDQPEVTGTYRVRAYLGGGDLGTLSEVPPSQFGQPQVEFNVKAEQDTVVYFTPPTGVQTGATELCIMLVDRPSVDPQCVPLTWNPPVVRLEARAQIAHWYDAIWPVLRVTPYAADNTVMTTDSLVTYRVLATADPNVPPALYYAESTASWDAGFCQIFTFDAESTYVAFKPSQATGLVEFEVVVPGAGTEPLVAKTQFLIGAQQVYPSYDTTLMTLLDGADPAGTLQFGGSPFDIYHFQAVSTEPVTAQAPITALVRLFVPATAIDFTESAILSPGGALDAVTSLEILDLYHTTNVQLTLTGDRLPLAYAEPEGRFSEGGGDSWHAIYFWAQAEPQQIYPVVPASE